MTNQKQIWANRADRYEAAAARKSAEAARLYERKDYERDHAFLTQPGRIAARDQMNRRMERAHEMQMAANRAAEKAANLRAMATRNAGDAEAARQAVRDAFALQAGDKAVSVHYGPCEVVKVNAKSVRIRTASGFVTTQDKSFVKRAA